MTFWCAESPVSCPESGASGPTHVVRDGTHERADAACHRGNRTASSLVRHDCRPGCRDRCHGDFVGRGSGLLGLLAAGPLLACARGNGRVTALIAAYAIALCAIAAGITGTTVGSGSV